jgi:ubiquinone/menaquinone biosynthesis C-methylase UbiE
MSVSLSIELDLRPGEAFNQFTAQMKESLERAGIYFSPDEKGSIIEQNLIIGRITEWVPNNKIELEWHAAASWDSSEHTILRFKFEPLNDGKRTKITVENEGWGDLLGDTGQELSEWFADEIASKFIEATSPERFANWIIDKRARKPTGARARETYGNPIYHRPNFKALLRYLKLTKEDYLVEIGCGGGAFLFDALKTGCRAAAIDHSPDMVRLAREQNSKAIEEGRLKILESEADSLPFSDETFTCAVTTGVFAFIEHPDVVMSEIFRILNKGGRLALFTGSKELRGTPAAPEPGASRLHFYEDDELVDFARRAGFTSARVERPSLEQFAKESGVPEEAMPLFSVPGGAGQFLLAWK